jgi:3-polyprenyl-4-hydroxybenzoate decarboxylase
MFVPGHHGRAMMEKYWAKGKHAPVVITAGQEPLLYCAACAPLARANPTMHGSAMIHALGAQLITSASVWDALEREVPNVQSVYSLYQPCQLGSTMLVVSIRQSFAGHAKQAAFAALGSHAGVLMNKTVIVVDEDVDSSNLQDVLFAVMSRCNPSEDIDIVRGVPTNAMDPALTYSKRSINEYKSSSMIIDATRKPFSMKDKFPRVNVISPELKSKTIAKWESILKLK